MADKLYKVKNRSASRVIYSIPEDRIRRIFAPGETKMISGEELVKLTWQPGGKEMLLSFLQISEEEALNELNIHAQPEYFMNEEQVKELLLNGSYEAFLDCLDFAPVGVMDLIKKIAVELPLGDYQKKQALKEKTGFDVDKAIANDIAEKTPEAETESAAAAPVNGRRTAPNYTVASNTSSERRTAPTYNIVSKDTKTLNKKA